ncbi:ferredoxin [Streptomyces sp. G-G2]|uniref:ferredoxin n=1 Tax=Streptomyces sp. G-G2 TaxID=3046201 RepID=UPI0024B8B145|nr:ferredoxin [Streptomyces sp. G-G2]MDJ0382048.1 ferredoxin [Streptomyces sp. G-G2]
MTGTWTVHADRQLCLGSGMCAAVAPEVFALEDEHASVRQPETGEDPRLLDAADICPAQAITVRADGKVIAPRGA